MFNHTGNITGHNQYVITGPEGLFSSLNRFIIIGDAFHVHGIRKDQAHQIPISCLSSESMTLSESEAGVFYGNPGQEFAR